MTTVCEFLFFRYNIEKTLLQNECGYGIVAITSVFQTEEMGSIPIIRLEKGAIKKIWVDARVAKGGGL